MPTSTFRHLTSHGDSDPLFQLTSTESQPDPLEFFTPETRLDAHQDVGEDSAVALTNHSSVPPHAQERVEVVKAINDVEKQIEHRLSALDERSRHAEERLTAFETLAAEMRATVRALDDSIETRIATVNPTSHGVDIIAPRFLHIPASVNRLKKPSPYQRPMQSSGHWLSALGALAILVIVSVAIMRSIGGADHADQTGRRIPAQSTPPSQYPANPPIPPQTVALTRPQSLTTTSERPSAKRPQPQRQAQATPKVPAPEPRRPLFVGTLAVRSYPSGAAVFLNGRAVGTTPLQLARVRAGSSALRIEHERYKRWTASVLVPADQQTTIDAKLEVEERRSR